MTTSFVHLNVHSEYSIQDGICRLEELIEQAKAQGYRSIALTDHCNLFAQVKFYKAAIKAGLKPIIGADVWSRRSECHAIFTPHITEHESKRASQLELLDLTKLHSGSRGQCTCDCSRLAMGET